MSKEPICVVTTVYPPGRAVQTLEQHFPSGRLLVIGDGKTPENWRCESADYYSLDRQAKLPFTLAHCTPKNHYVRKNLGYLLAIASGASVIYDTDDDNISNSAWRIRSAVCAAELVEEPGWCNPYPFFHPASIWPRGFPLDQIQNSYRWRKTRALMPIRCPIQQGLADRAPDVDAIWRLVACVPDVLFQRHRSIALGPGVWCPFNSQSTWWWPEAYPLLYLPVTALFRMTDIWRSFVAQCCLWKLGLGVAHHSPSEVEQARNPHDLLRDFADEVPGYLHNGCIAAILDDLDLVEGQGAVCDNLLACYTALVEAGILSDSELAAVRAWVADIRELAY